METVSALFPFALILVAFYFLIIRPARVRQRAAQATQEQARPGTEVMTTSGIFGRVVTVTDDRFEVEVAPGTTIWFAKAAVARVLPAEVPGDDDPAGTGSEAGSLDSDAAPADADADRPGQDHPSR